MESDPKREKSGTLEFDFNSPKASNQQTDEPLTQAFSDVGTQVSAIQEHLGQFFEAKADALKLKFRHAAISAALVIVALIALASFLATSVVLLISGIAGGVTELVGGRVWLGNSITALGLLATGVLLVYFKLARLKAARLRELVEKYERRKTRQRDRTGPEDAERGS